MMESLTNELYEKGLSVINEVRQCVCSKIGESLNDVDGDGKKRNISLNYFRCKS